MREEIQAYVSLGSNSADAERMLQLAREALGNLPHVRLGAVSPIYATEPQGFADQPWFLNQVVELFVARSWQPCAFVEALLQMEAGLGRVRSADPALRFGPRAIDADLLLFGQQQNLFLVHKYMLFHSYDQFPMQKYDKKSRKKDY